VVKIPKKLIGQEYFQTTLKTIAHLKLNFNLDSCAKYKNLKIEKNKKKYFFLTTIIIKNNNNNNNNKLIF